MFQAAILVVLTLTGTIAVLAHHSAEYLLGARQRLLTSLPDKRFLIQMVEGREDLASAIGLNSSMFNAARLVVPQLPVF